MPIKAALLIRVSDPKQEREGLSLDNQEDVLRRYAAEKGFVIAKEYRFQESADRKIRTRFMEMIQYVKRHKDVQVIIAYRVDRMTRNYRDHVMMDDLRSDYDKELHFVYDHLVISKKTVGRDIQDWDTKAYLAKQFLNRLKEDARNSAEYKLRRGEKPGKAPFGFCNQKRADGKNWIFVDEGEAPVVRLMFEWYGIGGCSMEGVRHKVQQEFGITLSKGMVDQMLRNPFYCGDILYDGKLYPHAYEVLVSRSRFDRVQAMRKAHNKQPVKFAGLPFLYRGIIRCGECGCSITPERKIKKDAVYLYYHCTEYNGKHDAFWMREEAVTEQLQTLFNKLAIPEPILQKVIGRLQETNRHQSEYAIQLQKQLKDERERYEQRLTVMYDDKLDGTITAAHYEEKKAEYKVKQNEIDSRLEQLGLTDDQYFLSAIAFLKMISRLPQLFHNGDLEEKRMILKVLLQNCVLKEKKLLWELTKPIQAVFSQADRQLWLPLTNMFLNREIELNSNERCMAGILERQIKKAASRN